MKITMVAVVSINSKVTRNSDPNIYKWTSKEDQRFFFDQIRKAKLIVMGSGTYEGVSEIIKENISYNASLARRGLAKLRIVLTSSPEKYKSQQVKGQLEFSSETPRQLINRLIDYNEMLLVGGSKVYSSFMKGGLIDEIYLTVEPVIFAKGKPLFAEEDFETSLDLVSIRKLNNKGTLLLKYIVNR